MVNLEFLGGVQEVGRSSTLVESSSKILVDCGLKQGVSGTSYPRIEDIENESIDSVILTHAHLDHSGGLPWLIEGKTPLYGEREVREALSRLFIVGYDSFKANYGISAKFGDAGHILGSGWISVEAEGIRITFSGDLGEGRSNHLKIPEKPPHSDVLVLESTYGATRQHHRLLKVLKDIVEVFCEDVPVLVPVEAVGKSMEILRLIMQRKKSSLKLRSIWYDGMISDIVPIYREFFSSVYMNESVSREIMDSREFDPFLGKEKFRTPNTLDQRELIARENKPKILAPSGMLKGGWSTYYLKEFAKNREDARVLLLGYQAEGTPGRVLQEAEKGKDAEVCLSSPIWMEGEGDFFRVEKSRVKVPSEWICHLEGFSLHASANYLLDFARKVSPERLLVVHGDLKNAEELKEILSDDPSLKYSEPAIPKLHQRFEFKGKQSDLEGKVLHGQLFNKCLKHL